MLSLSPYFSARAFIAVKSLTVVPHREATLSTSVGLPAKDLKSALEPSILLAEKSMSVDMLTAARAATPREEMPTLKAEPSVCARTSIPTSEGASKDVSGSRCDLDGHEGRTRGRAEKVDELSACVNKPTPARTSVVTAKLASTRIKMGTVEDALLARLACTALPVH